MVNAFDAKASGTVADPPDQPKSLLGHAQQEVVRFLLNEAREVSLGAKKARERLIALFEARVREESLCLEYQSDCNIAILLIIDGFLVNDKPVEQLISRINKVIVSFGKHYKRGNYASNILDAFPGDKKWQEDLEAVLCIEVENGFIDIPDPMDMIENLDSNLFCQRVIDEALFSVSPGTLELLKYFAESPAKAYKKYAVTPKRLKKIVCATRQRIRNIIGA